MNPVFEPAKPLFKALRYRVRKHVLRTADAFDEWFHDRGDETLSLQHALNEGSVVFEVGGYRGNWSSRIIDLYDPTIHIFEPVEAFYSILRRTLNGYPKVKTYKFGLSDQDQTTKVTVAGDSSGQFGSGQVQEMITLKDIHGFVRAHAIATIDLIQINIEGGEYQLLQRMLETQIAKQCRVIQVQFHRNVPDAEQQREDLRRRLAETHSLLYDYPFVWEAWKLREHLSEKMACRSTLMKSDNRVINPEASRTCGPLL